MRFLNLAVHDSNDMLGELTSEVTNSSGAMGTAYNTMFGQPASQAQLFSNNVDVLKTEIGDALLPAMNKLLGVGINILQWFRDMDPHVRELIVRITVVAFAFITVTGLVVTFVGALMILDAVLKLLTTTGGLKAWLGKMNEAAIGIVVLAIAVWGLVHAFQALQDNDVGGAIIGIATAIAALTYAFATFDVVAGVTAAVAAALSIPFILAAALIAALVVAVLALAYVIYRNWDTIRDKTTEVWG